MYEKHQTNWDKWAVHTAHKPSEPLKLRFDLDRSDGEWNCFFTITTTMCTLDCVGDKCTWERYYKGAEQLE